MAHLTGFLQIHFALDANLPAGISLVLKISTGHDMRPYWFIILLGIVPACGCASMIIARGKDFREVQSRDQVHEILGAPRTVGVSEGQQFEEYRIHCKISEFGRCEGMGITELITLGLVDVVVLPVELARAGRQVIFGQTLRFTYDQHGIITEGLAHGRPIYGLTPIVIHKDPNKPPDQNGTHTDSSIASDQLSDQKE